MGPAMYERVRFRADALTDFRHVLGIRGEAGWLLATAGQGARQGRLQPPAFTGSSPARG